MKYFITLILILKINFITGNDLKINYIGKNDWINTTTVCYFTEDQIFAIEKENLLSSTNIKTGKKIVIGKLDLNDVIEIYCINKMIFVINIDGDLYIIDPQTANIKQSKKQFLFGGLKYAVSFNHLFMIDSFGNIYKIHLQNFEKQKLKISRTFSDVLYFFVMPQEEKVIIDINGRLYLINQDGLVKEIRLKNANFMKTITHSLLIKDYLYLIDILGSLYKIEINSAKWQLLGNVDQFKRIKHFFTDNNSLYFISETGDLFFIK